MTPSQAAAWKGHLTGADLCNYLEEYYNVFLRTKVKFSFNTEVLEISRQQDGKWLVRTEDKQDHKTNTLQFCRIIVATGVSHLAYDGLSGNGILCKLGKLTLFGYKLIHS